MKQDPRWRETDEAPASGSRHTFKTRPMTFEERVRAMGYETPDPNYYEKHGNYHRKVVMACIAWIVLGAAVSSFSILTLYNRHTNELDSATQKNTMILMNARANARMYNNAEERNTELKKKWDEDRIKREEMNNQLETLRKELEEKRGIISWRR